MLKSDEEEQKEIAQIRGEILFSTIGVNLHIEDMVSYLEELGEIDPAVAPVLAGTIFEIQDASFRLEKVFSPPCLEIDKQNFTPKQHYEYELYLKSFNHCWRLYHQENCDRLNLYIFADDNGMVGQNNVNTLMESVDVAFPEVFKLFCERGVELYKDWYNKKTSEA